MRDSPSPTFSLSGTRYLYTALFYGALPLVLLRLFWRGRKIPAYRQRIAERFGYYRYPPTREVVWFHTVSVGEAEAAFPLIRELRERHPEQPVLVTTTTPTGSARVAATLGERVSHCYLPYDLPGCVRRFLAHHRPRLAVVLETEIWPNLYRSCTASGTPVAIVNARLSAKSAAGYRRVHGLMAECLSEVTWIAAQTGSDAERFLSLGARPAAVSVTGNIKFDLKIPPELVERGAHLRRFAFGGRKVWIAASTHSGEEEQILAAFSALQERFPGLLLVLAPRHPERFSEVAELCIRRGHRLVRRSENRSPIDAAEEIFLLDTLGELKEYYAASDVAFVGGSLAPVGGHNVLEPAALGVPVVFGPHIRNFREVCGLLLNGGGARQVAGTEELTTCLSGLLGDSRFRTVMGEQGRQVVEANRGAVRRIADRLDAFIPEPSTPADVSR